MRFPSRHNAPRHQPIIIHHRSHITKTGPSLPEDGNSCNHRNHRATTRVIPMRGQPHLLPTRVNPAHPKPATIAHQPPRPSSARNTTNRHHRRPRHQDRRDKIRTKTVPATTPTTVPAMVRVAVRGIDWPLVLLVKRRGVQVAPGVFAFATPPPLAKSARGHHAAAI
jgi:hypothetical protein